MPDFNKTITIYNSKSDRFGNRYWAFTFVDHKTGKEVRAKISGDESNIRAISRNWGDVDDWDRSFQFHQQELGIRQFNSMIKDWAYAGCTPVELVTWIKSKLAE